MKDKIKRKAIKYFIIFLAVMLIMTFVSRMFYTERMPRVRVTQIKNHSIPHEYELNGVTEALKQQPVFIPEGLRAAEVMVEEGDKVIKNQLIMKLDREFLHNKAALLEKEIKEELEQNSAYSPDGNKPVFTEAGLRVSEVCVKAGDSVSAGQLLLRLDSDYLGRRIETMQNDIDADMMSRDGLYENEEQRSAEALTKAIESKQREIERYIDIYNNDGAVYSDWTGVVTGVTVRAGDVTSDGAAVLISSEPDISFALLEKQEKLEALRKADENKGNIYSPSEGVITAKNVFTGGFTGEGASFLVSDISDGLIFRAEMDDIALRAISVGDVYKLKFRNNKLTVEGCKVKRIAKTPDGSGYTAELTVENKELKAGEIGYLKGSSLSDEIYCCMPFSAINFTSGETRGDIFVIEESEGFFGKEYSVRKYSVSVRDRSNAEAGVDNSGFPPDGKVVIASSKKLHDGQKVRI